MNINEAPRQKRKSVGREKKNYWIWRWPQRNSEMPEQYAATLLSIKDAFIHMQSILAESNLCVIGYDYITQTQDS